MLIKTPFLTDRDIRIDAERTRLEKMQKDRAENTASKDTSMKVKPSTFVESVYMLDGRPFRLKDRDYLIPIYDLPIERGILFCGRQVEKSTTASTKIANDALGMPYCRVLYFAPQNSQVAVFSTDRLARLFTYSQEDVIKKEYLSRDDTQNVHNKSFANGSLIYLRHAYDNGDNIRGISVNEIFGDEIQDVDVDAIPVIEECQAHARELGPGIKRSWFSGTPKTFSNTIQQLFDDSNQQEWVVRCYHCGCDQILGVANIAPDKYICRKCAKEITRNNISKNARWVKMKQTEEFYGYRITQMMNPSMLPSDIFQKMMRYPQSRFANEVLGRSYENASKPMPASLLKRILDTNLAMYHQRSGEFQNMPLFMGIDWGHGTSSFTVVTIKGMNSYGKWQVLYTKIYNYGEEIDPEFQIVDIMNLMNAFEITYCIADYGDGFQQGRRLKNMFGPRFDMCYYSHNQRELIKYNPETFTYVVRRTSALTEYVDVMKALGIVWPAADYERVKHMYEHHIVVQVEYRKSNSKAPSGNITVMRSEEMVYTHPMSKPDDGFHSGFYSWFAGKLYYDGKINSYEFNNLEFSGVSF